MACDEEEDETGEGDEEDGVAEVGDAAGGVVREVLGVSGRNMVVSSSAPVGRNEGMVGAGASGEGWSPKERC